jgi:xylitol oxidase
LRNWAGNHVYRAHRVHQPSSVEQVQEIVRSARQVRALGSRHSFNDIADTPGDLISLAGLPRVVTVDPDARTVSVDGGILYGDLCAPLHEAGYALHSLASLAHISVAGACATGSHGSGNRIGNLSTAVTAFRMVGADGEIVAARRSDDPARFAGMVVSLGALGLVTELTLDVQPSFQMRQDVFEDLEASAFVSQFDRIASLAESVSFFTEWRRGAIDQVWLKSRVTSPGEPAEPGEPGLPGLPGELLGARRATKDLHPIKGLSAAACTPQLGVVGPWHERLPHFRMSHTPSSGHELQSEYLVAYGDAPAAFMALDQIRERIAPLVQISEIRTIEADDLWLSPAFGRRSVAFHFTWRPDWKAVRGLLPEIESALAPYEPRPHWAKLHTMAPGEVRARYPLMPAFVRLAEGCDRWGKFRNDYLATFVFDELPIR